MFFRKLSGTYVYSIFKSLMLPISTTSFFLMPFLADIVIYSFNNPICAVSFIVNEPCFISVSVESDVR